MLKKQEIALRRVLKWSGWSYQGGRPDASLRTIRRLLEEAGFKKRKVKSWATIAPDGSRLDSGESLVHPLGLIASFSDHIGSTKFENSYHFRIEVVGRD